MKKDKDLRVNQEYDKDIVENLKKTYTMKFLLNLINITYS